MVADAPDCPVQCVWIIYRQGSHSPFWWRGSCTAWFVPAAQFQVVDKLVSHNGESIEITTVYNLRSADFHYNAMLAELSKIR